MMALLLTLMTHAHAVNAVHVEVLALVRAFDGQHLVIDLRGQKYVLPSEMIVHTKFTGVRQKLRMPLHVCVQHLPVEVCGNMPR